jgi:TolB protein
MFVYQKQIDGHWQLFTSRPDGSGERQITHTLGDSENSDWSPVGKRIAFEYNSPHEKGCAVTVIDADGSNRTDLSVGRDCDNQPSFTPDGKRIVFVRYVLKTDKESIQSMDLTGGDAHVIGGINGDTDPNVSPDGKNLSFLRIKKDEKQQALFAMDIDGSNVRQLTSSGDEVARKHAWAPDGSRIVITTSGDFVGGKSANILTMRPDGSDRRQVTHYSGGPIKGLNAFAGSFSPDGEHIVLRVERNDRGGLAVIDPDGRNLHMITPIADPKPKAIDWGTRAGRQAGGAARSDVP